TQVHIPIIQYLIQLYPQQTFTKPPQKLHIPHPSLTHQIKKLHHQLHTPLFIPNYPQLTPTPQPNPFIKTTQTIFNEPH
ncbi:helix-turn-helix domain-containing protein, partial [Bacillus altitudinis]|uniref:helix-turn-helix domain-containing protein n=1 Tax=Bacillus altitudinis TaxID=293387 RepID=UPI0011A7A4B6